MSIKGIITRATFKTEVAQGISGQNSRKKMKWCPRKRQDVGLPQLNIGHRHELYKMLLVCHCERDSGHTIRIISARKATKNERKLYKGSSS
jgi:uncharacterized DUF497 family protein